MIHRPFALLSSILLLVLIGSCLFACRSDDEPAKPTDAERIAALEQRLADVERRHLEAQKLIIRVLDASSSRLDRVLESVTGQAPQRPAPAVDPSRTGTVPAGKNAAGPDSMGTDPMGTDTAQADPETKHLPNRDPANAQTGERDPGEKEPAKSNEATEKGLLSDIDFVQMIVIFLAVALVVLVVLVVFFPGPLRGSVPQIEYTAIEDEAIAGLQADPEPTLVRRSPPRVAPLSASPSTPPTPRTTHGGISHGAARPGAADAYADNAAVGQPVAHELVLPIDDPDTVTDYAEVLDSFLSTEPYILNEPSPQVAIDDGELHLRFFALPTLSTAEHTLLDDAVRRLRPHRPGPRRTAG